MELPISSATSSNGTICNVGYWENSNASCAICINRPSHSSYTTAGWANSNCPYQCDSGYYTSSCLDLLQVLMFHWLTLGGVAALGVAVLLIIFPSMRKVLLGKKCKYNEIEEDLQYTQTIILFRQFYQENWLFQALERHHILKRSDEDQQLEGKFEQDCELVFVNNPVVKFGQTPSQDALKVTDKNPYTDNSCASTLFTNGGMVSILLSAVKLFVVVLFSLSTNQDFLYCGDDPNHLNTCTTGDAGGSETCMKHTINEKVVSHSNPCSISITFLDLCNNWVIFTMSVLICNLIHVVYQAWWYYTNSYSPNLLLKRQPQYYIFLALDNISSYWRDVLYSGLSCNISFICFLDCWVIIMSCMGVGAGISCGSYINIEKQQFNSFSFALVVTLMSAAAINLSLAATHWKQQKFLALIYLIRLDLTILHLVFVAIHSGLFALSSLAWIIRIIFTCLYV